MDVQLAGELNGIQTASHHPKRISTITGSFLLDPG